jgi:urocanate hydratase
MLDGSDAISDWAVLSAMVSIASIELTPTTP